MVNIIAACCGECESITLLPSILDIADRAIVQDTTYPRLQTIKDLRAIMSSHPRLTKDAGSALADLGAAIKDVATREEIREMIAGTLSKDSQVRNAALQAMQVSTFRSALP